MDLVANCGLYKLIQTELVKLKKIEIADNYGPYYWHIKSGNIQREPPESTLHSKEARKSFVKNNESVSARTNDQLTFMDKSSNQKKEKQK